MLSRQACYKTFFERSIQLAYPVDLKEEWEIKLKYALPLSEKIFMNMNTMAFSQLWSVFWIEDICLWLLLLQSQRSTRCSPSSFPLMRRHAGAAVGEKEKRKITHISKYLKGLLQGSPPLHLLQSVLWLHHCPPVLILGLFHHTWGSVEQLNLISIVS